MKQFYRLFKKGRITLSLDKRQRFAVQTIILTGGLVITQFGLSDHRFFLVGILTILSYFLTAWSLSEDITGQEWFLLFILPVLFTFSVSLFYFLLPPRMISRFLVTGIFAICTYAILLVENIYNVAVNRSIQLTRAAQSIGLLLTLVVIFLSSNVAYSLRLSFWQNALILTPISFVLAVQSIWSVTLEEKLSKNLVLYAGIIAVSIGELSMVLSFWPIVNAAYSLFLTSLYYSLLGIVQHYFLGRLFRNTVKEYFSVFLFTFLLTFLITQWG